MKLTREHALTALIGTAIAGAGVWFAMHTEWVDVEVPTPPTGAAARDMNYQLKQLATRLGATVTAPDNLDHLPPPGATLVLTSWYWNLFPERSQALRRWVEAGGDLWLPSESRGDKSTDWIPVKWLPIPRKPAADKAASAPASKDDEDDEDDVDVLSRRKPVAPAPPASGPITSRPARPSCAGVVEPADVTPAFGVHRSYAGCLYASATLKTGTPPLWALDGPHGHVMARVALGHGTITVASAYVPWNNGALLDSDNALVAVAALRLHPGQDLWIVADEARPPLLAFLWDTGAPAILLGVAALTFALWRGGVRFGPRAAPLPTARRSVAEQIRGTADFVAHHGGVALHRAQMRALSDAARSRIHGFDALIVGERAQAIAQATRLDAHALARAMNPTLTSALNRHPPAALALIEAARRRLLSAPAPPRTESR